MAKAINLIGNKQLKRNMQQIAKHYPEQLGKALLAEIFKILRISNRRIRTDTGATKASQYTELEIRDGKITVEGGYKSNVALKLDQGTNPGEEHPSSQAIAEWAIRKNIVSDPDEAKTFGYFVAKKIEKNGREEDLFFTNSVNEQRISLEKEIGEFIIRKQNELARKVK